MATINVSGRTAKPRALGRIFHFFRPAHSPTTPTFRLDNQGAPETPSQPCNANVTPHGAPIHCYWRSITKPASDSGGNPPKIQIGSAGRTRARKSLKSGIPQFCRYLLHTPNGDEVFSGDASFPASRLHLLLPTTSAVAGLLSHKSGVKPPSPSPSIHYIHSCGQSVARKTANNRRPRRASHSDPPAGSADEPPYGHTRCNKRKYARGVRAHSQDTVFLQNRGF
jgi:hypothetical protein